MIWNFIISLGAGFLCERVGRRPLFLISVVGMFFMWALQTACLATYSEKGIMAAGHATMAFICELYIDLWPVSAQILLFVVIYYAFYDVSASFSLSIYWTQSYCILACFYTIDRFLYCGNLAILSPGQGFRSLQLRHHAFSHIQSVCYLFIPNLHRLTHIPDT